MVKIAKKVLKVEKPFLAAAVFCENILDDKDGMLSAIRILDTIKLSLEVMHPIATDAQTLADTKRPFLPVLSLISFKSGNASGKRQLQIILFTPSGDRHVILEAPVEFLGGAHGVNVK